MFWSAKIVQKRELLLVAAIAVSVLLFLGRVTHCSSEEDKHSGNAPLPSRLLPPPPPPIPHSVALATDYDDDDDVYGYSNIFDTSSERPVTDYYPDQLLDKDFTYRSVAWSQRNYDSIFGGEEVVNAGVDAVSNGTSVRSNGHGDEAYYEIPRRSERAEPSFRARDPGFLSSYALDAANKQKTGRYDPYIQKIPASSDDNYEDISSEKGEAKVDGGLAIRTLASGESVGSTATPAVELAETVSYKIHIPVANTKDYVARCSMDGYPPAYTSILWVSPSQLIEEGPYCACPGGRQEPQWSSLDKRSFTWYHHERLDWKIQYRFCDPVFTSVGSCSDQNMETNVATITVRTTEEWRPRLEELTCRCPDGQYYMTGWKLSVKKSPNGESSSDWKYLYACERVRCKERAECMRQYFDHSATHTVSYHFICSCPLGSRCPTEKDDDGGERVEPNELDEQGPYRAAYCRRLPSREMWLS